MNRHSETFFRSPELKRIAWTLPAEIYNRSRWILNRVNNSCVFVPIRTMQYLAVIDREEIIFIDSAGGYRTQNQQGGRLIQLAWRDFQPQQRQGLDTPVAFAIVYYLPEAEQTMKWLIGEFSSALNHLEQRYKQTQPPLQQAVIIPLTSCPV